MHATVAVKCTPNVFPGAAVNAALRKALLEGLRAEAQRKNRTLPANDVDLAKLDQDIDSLFVVEILCVLDTVLPFEVSESVVRRGGYSSVNAALAHLAGTVEAAWKAWAANGGAP
jgi:hypothetical protein